MSRTSMAKPQRRRLSLPLKSFAILLMLGGSLVATSGTASAAPRPSSLADIDVTSAGKGVYVVGALTSSGVISAEVVVCPTRTTNCQKHGWKSLGGGFKSVAMQPQSGDGVVAIARRSNGDTWYRRGTCAGTSCSWASWYSLGGKVTKVATSNRNSCAYLVGTSPSSYVYEAKICRDSVTGWSSTGGKLSQIGSYSNKIFGTSSSGALWWNHGYGWTSAGGRITQPAVNIGKTTHYCGLAGAGRNLWCANTSNFEWTNYGGYWRKLDDGKTIGISKYWRAWSHDGRAATSYGGNVNQWATSGDLMVGVGAGYGPWYQNTYRQANGWLAL
ncbi:MAG: hypothetical protein WAX05_11075 [Candidatus Microthrix parvicella]